MPDWTARAARRMYEGAGLEPKDVDIFNPYDGYARWRSAFWRPSSGTASNAAMPSRSTRVTSGSRDRTRSARAAAIWGTGAPVRPCMPTASSSSAAPPAHGRSRFGRDGAGGIHHAKQRRLDHVRQTPELTASDNGDHRLAAITFGSSGPPGLPSPQQGHDPRQGPHALP